MPDLTTLDVWLKLLASLAATFVLIFVPVSNVISERRKREAENKLNRATIQAAPLAPSMSLYIDTAIAEGMRQALVRIAAGLDRVASRMDAAEDTTGRLVRQLNDLDDVLKEGIELYEDTLNREAKMARRQARVSRAGADPADEA